MYKEHDNKSHDQSFFSLHWSAAIQLRSTGVYFQTFRFQQNFRRSLIAGCIIMFLWDFQRKKCVFKEMLRFMTSFFVKSNSPCKYQSRDFLRIMSSIDLTSPKNSNCGQELVQKSRVQINVGEGVQFSFHILYKKLIVET